MPNSIDKFNHLKKLSNRFQQAVLSTVVVLIVATISSFSFKEEVDISLFLLFDLLVMCSLFPLISAGKTNLAKQIFIWTNLFVSSYVFWSMGGLHSSAIILVYPMLMMMSALLVGPRTFFLSYLYIISFVTIISTNAINSGANLNSSQYDYWDLIVILLLLTAAGFTAWRFNSDMRYAMKKLKNEIINVNISRREIGNLIHYDSLTGLPSRIHGEKRYKELIKSINKDNEIISFLFIDIDQFKSINDYYDHEVGDEVLKRVSTRFQEFALENEIACRLNGDEYLLIVKRSNFFDIEYLAKCIQDEIAKTISIGKLRIDLTTSLGISSLDNDSEECFESLVRRSQFAADRAKQLGKSQYYFFDMAMYSEIQRKRDIIEGLKKALINNDLQLFLQPKVNIRTGKIESTEALIRWVGNNPHNISPAEFIPLIESTQLICQLGDWVIKQACKMCKDMHNNGHKDLTISVNVSSTQFMMGNLENTIIHELQAAQLEPKYLELELTEHILFQDNEDVLDELKRIKALGVNISIDDFGTGYSNLGYLTKFNVDTLKIDRSFVTDIHKLSNNYAIVDAIIKMAKTLGIKIVAEGVENQQEWDVLKQLGCDQGQGFVWSKPLDSIDLDKHLAEAA